MINSIHDLHRLIFRFDRGLDSLLQEKIGITFPQFMVLLAINGHHNCQQQDIADFRKLTKAAISKQMGGLKEKGWITIKKNVINRRENIVSITLVGRKIMDKGKEVLDEYCEKIFKGLSKKEVNQLSLTINKINKLL